jgi:hypothetical protein
VIDTDRQRGIFLHCSSPGISGNGRSPEYASCRRKLSNSNAYLGIKQLVKVYVWVDSRSPVKRIVEIAPISITDYGQT